MFAWVTLLTQPDYLVGVKALHHSLKQSNSQWPLVVMTTSAISAEDCQALQAEGCVIAPVEPIYPRADLDQHYASAQFGEVWTKLRAWQLTDYQRVVFLDADMLVLQNMDELFTLDLGDNLMAACHACRCNPNQIASYPADWQPEQCHYTWQARGEAAPASLDYYLNGGFLVLTPDRDVYDAMMARLAAKEDIAEWVFAEQDFLNEVFRNRWLPLHYGYNALKTLPKQHPQMWDLSRVKNIHYIIDKPWDKYPEPGDKYYDLHKMWWQHAQVEA